MVKPRKEGETDAQYIGRLEQANANLRRENARWSEQIGVYNSRARPAAYFTGAVLHAAAEACGMADDPRVGRAAVVLDQLSGLPWQKTIPEPTTLPTFGAPNLEANGGDCEMLLRSAYEALGDVLYEPLHAINLFDSLRPMEKNLLWRMLHALMRLADENLTTQARALAGVPKPREAFNPPKVETLDQARDLIQSAWFEVCDVLSDVEIGRACLRLDLRSTMYRNAFDRIAEVMGGADRAVADLPRAPAPFDDEAVIPF